MSRKYSPFDCLRNVFFLVATCSIYDPSSGGQKITLDPAWHILLTLPNGFVTLQTWNFMLHHIPFMVCPRTTFSPRFGISDPFAALYPFPDSDQSVDTNSYPFRIPSGATVSVDPESIRMEICSHPSSRLFKHFLVLFAHDVQIDLLRIFL